MKDPTARSVMHGAITTQCPRPMPVTPLTPLRGACPAGVAHAPQRCGPPRCPHAPLRRLADSNLRRAHATGSEQILPPPSVRRSTERSAMPSAARIVALAFLAALAGYDATQNAAQPSAH